MITLDILWMVQRLYLIATSTFQAGKSRLSLPIIIRMDAKTKYAVSNVHKDTTGSQDVSELAKCPVISYRENIHVHV